MTATEDHRNTRLGVAFGAAAALAYAFTIIFGSKLAKAGLAAPTALSIRFGISGVLLLGACALRRTSLRPAKGEWVGIFLLGAIGYMVESSFFFASLARGTAATTTLIFYVYPALVTVIEAVRNRRRPSLLMLGALAMSVGGSALVAAGGASLAISTAGIVFALCSAAAFAAYVTVGARLNEHSDAVVTGAWVALGASASFTVRALIGPGYETVHGHWPLLTGNGVANAVAFGAMFAALGLLGPARAAVVLTLEAVFAVILSTALLDESITAVQLVGAVGVLAAAVTVSRMTAPSVAETEAAAP